MNNNIIDGRTISMFKTVSLSIGQAQKENRNGIKSRYIVLGVKNSKSMLGKKQNIMLFEEDLSPEIFEVLGKFAKPSTLHPGGFDVNLSEFRNSPEFNNDRETLNQLLELPGGCFEEYEFAKGPCYANDVNGNMVKDRNNQPVIKSSIAVFVQIDYIKAKEDGSMETVYIEPYSRNAQGQRMESRFFMHAVDDNSASQQQVFDPTSLIGGTAPQQPAQQPNQQPAQQPGVQVPPIPNATAPVM